MTKWKDRTRGGFEYRIDDENAGGDFPIRGSIKTIDEYYRPTGWHSNGHYFDNGDTSDFDLVPADPEPVEQVRSLDEYAKQMQIANQQILKDQGVDIELDDWVSVSETKRKVFRSYARAVLDLANVKYREGDQ